MPNTAGILDRTVSSTIPAVMKMQSEFGKAISITRLAAKRFSEKMACWKELANPSMAERQDNMLPRFMPASRWLIGKRLHPACGLSSIPQGFCGGTWLKIQKDGRETLMTQG